MRSNQIKKGQVLRVKTYGGPRHAFVYDVEGVRVDLVFSDGRKDSVFIEYLAPISDIVSQIQE